MYGVLHILERDDESGEKPFNNLLVLSSLWFMCLYALKVSHTALEVEENCGSTKERWDLDHLEKYMMLISAVF